MERNNLLRKMTQLCKEVNGKVMSFEEHKDFYSVSVMIPKNKAFQNLLDQSVEVPDDQDNFPENNKNNTMDVLKATLVSMDALNDRFRLIRDNLEEDVMKTIITN